MPTTPRPPSRRPLVSRSWRKRACTVDRTPGGAEVPGRAALRSELHLGGRASPLLGFALGVLLVLVASPRAAAASVTAVLDREVIGLGDTAVLKVTVEGGSGREQPRIPLVNGLRAELAGSSTSFSIVQGRQTMAAEYSYSVTASRLGEYVIAPIVAVVGGQPVQAPPVALKVVPADDPAAARRDGLDKAAFLQLSLPRRPLYVGETFVAEIMLYAIGGRLKQAPQLAADGFTIGKLQDAGQESNIRTNNRIYSRLRFQQPMTAARAGELTVQAVNCALDIPLSRRTGLGELFDDAFFGLREVRTFNLATPPTVLTVRPLPRDGVPPGFGGAVGEFQVSLTASPTNVVAGDPITVRIDVAGRGNFDSVQLPEQSEWRGFRLYPADAKLEAGDPLGLTGVKRFEQVVTPETAEVAELPPFVFSYFAPEAGVYRTVRTKPVALRVGAGASSPAVRAPEGTAGPAGTPPPELVPLKPHLGTLLAPAGPLVTRPWFVALALFPPVAWLALRARRRQIQRRDADPESRRKRDLERRVDGGLRTLEGLAREGAAERFFATLFRLLQEAVAARTGQPPASITEGVVETDLAAAPAGVPPDTLAGLHRLFQACNQARYAPTTNPADLEALRREAAAVCASLRSSPRG